VEISENAKKGKNLPVKVAKTRFHPEMMSFLRDMTMKAAGSRFQ
jgi:hypothetical protein